MKRSLLAIIILLALLGAGGLIGYHFLDSNYETLGKHITSSDGSYTVSVPLKWKSVEPSSEYGLIAAQSTDGSMYMQLSLDTDTDRKGIALEEYTRSYIKSIAQKSDDSASQTNVVSPTSEKINGRKGCYYETKSQADGVSIYIWGFIYNTDSGIVNIAVASQQSEADAYSGIAKGIIRSVTEND